MEWPPGTTISIILREHDSHVYVTVAGTVAGIPEHERSKVLRRLYRLDNSRSTPGNGLGLSLVAAIAELHGAELELASNNPGLAVVLKFPRIAL